jgi:hypothetical protein
MKLIVNSLIKLGILKKDLDDRKADRKDGRHHGRDDELDDAFEKRDSIMSR